ncbi:MAG TPA: right-handed parallel beta-helix repeat-containing protein [Solirubrobacteraceae bacterium]|nr:right-handed parallel beta-helix repeat-containing protein [Solirubrobacteraceae bacterium]
MSALAAPAADTPPRAVLLGDTAVEALPGSLSAGHAEAFRFAAQIPGKVASLDLFVGRTSKAHGVAVALYSNSSGQPGRPIASGSASSLRRGAWNAVSVAPRTLVLGRTYWLVVLARGGTLRFRYSARGNCLSETSAVGRLRKLPAHWHSARIRARRCPISAFASSLTAPAAGPAANPVLAGAPSAVSSLLGKLAGSPAPIGETPSAGVPLEVPKAPPPSPACTAQVSSVSAAASLAASAAAGSAICLTPGSYGQLNLSGVHSGMVTVESVPGTAVKLGEVKVAANATNLTIHNFTIEGVNLAPGASNITIDHNDISGGGEGIVNSSVNCSSPNAPTYQGCVSTAPNDHITINGNKIHGYGEGGGEDAIHMSNWQNVVITANELYDLEEHGNHTDAFQSVFGGSNLTFDHNYEHDNQSQGFFIKDGDASNVTVNDNLFLRNDNLGEGENNIQVFNTTGFVMTKNTVWDGQGDLIRAEGAAEPLTATVNHNVEQLFSVLHESGPAYTLSEDYDIFKEPPLFGKGAHSVVVAKPSFVDAAANDYRLSSNPNGIGVDWAPSEYIYGPTGY